MGEIIFLAMFFVLSIYLYSLTGTFRASKMDASGGAAMFPRIVIILLCACLVIRIIQIIMQKEKKKFVWKELLEPARLFFVLCLVIYVVMLKTLGYIPATGLFLLVVVNRLYYLQKRNYGGKQEILIRTGLLIAFVIAMHFVFAGVLSVNLPKGFLV